MKQFLILLLLSIGFLLKAQDDTTVYHLALTNGKSLYCQFLAMEKGEFITVKKDDGAMQMYQWYEIKEYTPTAYSFKGKEMAEIRRKELLMKKYADWLPCYLILYNGDTLRRRIEYEEDYSLTGEGELQALKVADESGIEYEIPIDGFIYLILLGKEPVTYISFAPPPDGYRGIYKLIVDGKCKLLQDHYYRAEQNSLGGGTVSTGGPMGVGSMSMPYQRKEIDKDRFFLTYGDKWFKIREHQGFNITFDFHDRCKQIFSDCPDLVKSLQKPDSKMDDIREIVNTFNNCVGK